MLTQTFDKSGSYLQWRTAYLYLGECENSKISPSDCHLSSIYQSSVSVILYQRKQYGALAFPRMYWMELRSIKDSSKRSILLLQSRLLQSIRIRPEDPTFRRVSWVGHLRISRKIVTNTQFRDDFERLVPSRADWWLWRRPRRLIWRYLVDKTSWLAFLEYSLPRNYLVEIMESREASDVEAIIHIYSCI